MEDNLARHYSKLSIPGRPFQIVVRFVTYNVNEFVQQAIESVLSQQEVDLAIVVFDDASNDGTYETLLKLESLSPDRIFVSRPLTNTFASGKRELSILPLRMVEAEYIAFLDGDDYWTSNQKLARAVKVFDDATVSMVVHAISTVGHGNITKHVGSHWLFWNQLMMSESHIAKSVLKRLIAYPTNSVVMRYSSYPFNDYLEVNRSLTPDLLFKAFATSKGSVAFLPESMATLRIRGDSLWSPKSGYRQFFLTLRAAVSALKMWGVPYGYKIFRHALVWGIFVFATRIMRYRPLN